MFGWFKRDPKAQLQKTYQKLMEEAMHLQRNGDIKGYAAKVAEAEKVADQIAALSAG